MSTKASWETHPAYDNVVRIHFPPAREDPPVGTAEPQELAQVTSFPVQAREQAIIDMKHQADLELGLVLFSLRDRLEVLRQCQPNIVNGTMCAILAHAIGWRPKAQAG